MSGNRILIAIGLIVALALISTTTSADGTEVLGTPDIMISNGTGVVSAGTGAFVQPATIDIEVPLGATVAQVLVYWEGFMSTNVAGDDTIDVGGNSVTGTLIGGPTNFFSKAYASTYRADITGLGLISDGMNSVSIAGMDYTRFDNGVQRLRS